MSCNHPPPFTPRPWRTPLTSNHRQYPTNSSPTTSQRAPLLLQQRHGRAPCTSTPKPPRTHNTKPPHPRPERPPPNPYRPTLPCSAAPAALASDRPPPQHPLLQQPASQCAPLQLQQRNPRAPTTSTTKPPGAWALRPGLTSTPMDRGAPHGPARTRARRERTRPLAIPTLRPRIL